MMPRLIRTRSAIKKTTEKKQQQKKANKKIHAKNTKSKIKSM